MKTFKISHHHTTFASLGDAMETKEGTPPRNTYCIK